MKLLNVEKDLAVQQYWSGRLRQASDNTSALKHIVLAVEQGSSKADDRLIQLVTSAQCEWREKALEAVGELKLKRAKAAVAKVAESGGADDGKRTWVFGRCDSKQAAAEALRKLE